MLLLALCVQEAASSGIVDRNPRFDLRSQSFYTYRREKLSSPVKFSEVPEWSLPEGYPLSEMLMRLAPSSSCIENLIKQVINLLEPYHNKNFCFGDLRPENIFITKSGDVLFLHFAAIYQPEDKKCLSDINGLVSLNMSLLGVQVDQGNYYVDWARLVSPVENLVKSKASMVSPKMCEEVSLWYLKRYYEDFKSGKTSIRQYFLARPVAYNIYIAKHVSVEDMNRDLDRPKSLIVEKVGECLSILLQNRKAGEKFLSGSQLVEAIAAPMYYLHSNGLCHGNINADSVFIGVNYDDVYLTSSGNYYPLDENCSDIRNLGNLLASYAESMNPSAEFSSVKEGHIFQITQANGSTIYDILLSLDLSKWIKTSMYLDDVLEVRCKEKSSVPPAFIRQIVADDGVPHILKEKCLAAINKESKNLEAISHHKNIMGYFGVNTEIPALEVEYISGKDVENFYRNGTPNLSVLIAFLKQVTDGLIHMHSAGYCHNDLHRGNIRISFVGIVKIIDFDRTEKFEDLHNLYLRCGDMADFANTILAFRGLVEPRYEPTSQSYVNTLNPPALKEIVDIALSSNNASSLGKKTIFENMSDEMSVSLVKHYINNFSVYGIYEMYTMPIKSDQSSALFAFYPNKYHAPISYIPDSEIVRVRGHYLKKLLSRDHIPLPLIPSISKFAVDLLTLIKTMQSRGLCHNGINGGTIFIRANKMRDIILMNFYPVSNRMDTCANLQESKEVIKELIKNLPDKDPSMIEFVNYMGSTSDIDALIKQASLINDIPRTVHKCESILNGIMDEMKDNPIEVLESQFLAFAECISSENLNEEAITFYQDLLLQLAEQYFEDPRNMAEAKFTKENADFAGLLLKYQNAASASV